MENLKQQLQAAGIAYQENELLSAHCTFRIGGAADLFIQPKNKDEICKAVSLCRAEDARYYLLGNGSNVLFSDEGFRGAVINTSAEEEQLIAVSCDEAEPETVRISAPAGLKLSALCQFAQRNGYAGLEFAYGIPGTVGGAVYMNAGAYGGEIKNVLDCVCYLSSKGEEIRSVAADLDLSYRHSIFEENGGCILSADFHLSKGDPQQIKARMNELMAKRIDKQPLDKPSAGSTFKRPEGAFAAALIDQCGLRGYRHGGAAVSDKHCGFVVNLGGATCKDVLALCEEVKAIVKEKTGFVLEKEIRVVAS